MTIKQIAEQVFDHIKDHPCSTVNSIAQALKLEKDTVRNAVNRLRQRDHIDSTKAAPGVPCMYICPPGAKAPQPAAPKAPARQSAKLTAPTNGPGYTRSKWAEGQVVFKAAQARTVDTHHMRGTYDGAELRPYTDRTDANDHMRHGSMVGGKWQPYTPPGLMCVGAAGPVALLPAARGRFAA